METYGMLMAYYLYGRNQRVVTISFWYVMLKMMGILSIGTRQGLSQWILRHADTCLEGVQISRKRQRWISPFIGIDIWQARERNGRKFYVWLAVDLFNNEPIHYMVTDTKSIEAARRFIFELERGLTGYAPAIIVIDQEFNLVTMCKEAYPMAMVQLCVIHRMRIVDGLLALETEKFSDEQFALRMDFRDLVSRILHAWDPAQKARLIAKLEAREKEWLLDEDVEDAYLRLMADIDDKSKVIDYFHSRKELGDCPNNTNIVEERNREIEEMEDRMKGYKSPEALAMHVKAYWAIKRSDPNNVDLSSVFDIEKLTRRASLAKQLKEAAGLAAESPVRNPYAICLQLQPCLPSALSLPLPPPCFPAPLSPNNAAPLTELVSSAAAAPASSAIATEQAVTPFVIPADISEVRQQNAYAAAAVMRWANDRYLTAGLIAQMLQSWKPGIEMSNVSREFTSSGKILKQYIERERIACKNGKIRGTWGVRLNPEGRKLFDEGRLFPGQRTNFLLRARMILLPTTHRNQRIK